MELPFLKANEKLPRGSYFFIQVGHRFYAGEEAETREVEKRNREPTLYQYDKGKRTLNSRQRRWYSQDQWGWRSSKSYKTRNARDARKGTVATYRKPLPSKEKEVVQELTGRLNPRLVDEQNSAKKYRRQDLVQSACERLKVVYGGLDVKISVRFEQGEDQ